MRSLFVRRVGAYVLDCGILFSVLASVSLLGLFVLEVDPGDMTGLSLYLAIVVSFSVPVWAYFTLGDANGRATIGKQITGVRVALEDGESVGLWRSLQRTAVKLVPWELVHTSFFLAPAVGAPQAVTWTGAVLAYALIAIYVATAWYSGGRRSIHDVVVGSRVAAKLGLCTVSS